MDKTFKLKYTEDEYWSVYEIKYKKNSNIFTHFSTIPWIIVTSLFLLVSLMFGFVYNQNSNFTDLITCVITFLISLLFLAHTLKKCQELMITLKQIKTYYEYICNGIEITISKANIIFSYGNKKEIVQWVECKNIVIDEKYIQFYFYSRTPILIPKGLQTQQVMNQLENELESFL